MHYVIKISYLLKGFSETSPVHHFWRRGSVDEHDTGRQVLENVCSRFWTLGPYHLVFCHKKQENYAAISISCSVDAAKNAFNMFVNFTPLSVI